MSEFKNIPLKTIEATTQTRQFFDEAALNELADSIRKQGILQPILVREKGKKYQIIAGERRYRAAKIADLKFVPCLIVEMDDNQALEAQITENLQRKDVHPIEEAHAFKRLMDEAKFSLEDVAAKIGKSPRFVAQRLQLLKLIPAFQEIFFAEKLPLAGAVYIATLSEKNQQEYLDDEFADWQDEGFYYSAAEIKRDLDRAGEDLEDATFALDDAELVPSAGPCTTCKKNTACYSLLFQEEGVGRCTDSNCFEEKEKSQYKRTLQQVIDNHPDYIFLPNRYYNDEKKLSALKEMGVDIADPKAWKLVVEPSAPNPDEYDMSEEWEADDYASDVQRYEEELAEYKLDIASGKLRSAFEISSGKIVQVVPDTKTDPKAAAKEAAKQNPEEAKRIELEQQLSELKQKRERNEQLVMEKTFGKLQASNALGAEYITRGNGMNHLEDAALMMILFEMTDYGFQRDLANREGFERHKKLQVYKWLLDEANVDNHLEIMRAAILNRLGGAADMISRSGEITAYLSIAEEFLGKHYTELFSEKQAEYAKRNAAIDKQIQELKSQL